MPLGLEAGSGPARSRVSGFNYRRWREEAKSFEALALLGPPRAR